MAVTTVCYSRVMTFSIENADTLTPTPVEAAVQYVQSFGDDLQPEQVKELATGFERMLERERNIHALNVMRSIAVWLNDLGQDNLSNLLAEQSGRLAERTGLQDY